MKTKISVEGASFWKLVNYQSLVSATVMCIAISQWCLAFVCGVKKILQEKCVIKKNGNYFFCSKNMKNNNCRDKYYIGLVCVAKSADYKHMTKMKSITQKCPAYFKKCFDTI